MLRLRRQLRRICLSRPARRANPYLAPGELYKPIVWIDCEMTGLDHTSDHIIEVCCLVTDGHLNPVDDGYESVVHASAAALAAMDAWCTQHHGASGLTARALACPKSAAQVEAELLAYIRRLVPRPGRAVLAGNSVHMDRLFMLRDFPAVVAHLSHRIIDVSSLAEVCARHNPALHAATPRKRAAHTARADILESIAQLRWYRAHYLVPPEMTCTSADDPASPTPT
ncbi:ACR217Cp [Eremothecium gossypii ATCC 10895]|uniref:ACR217Cp n=1 Tax=Eremothecium gossypii (strain ATCC 10895 / CBS 109.51 / FGSC 9923 / NRRL Y-1056) TaxID=284811 RepID=Q75BQ4_EREGS|nr:ACR217Cp [Eremothecium gossypii ATCC 10895]AAS51443.1 ACR217Cp [Eremothecium gossypii ATCC 10895]AEY95734.1 FACR217Cp [Eremothecium gossypii FDAG1]